MQRETDESGGVGHDEGSSLLLTNPRLIGKDERRGQSIEVGAACVRQG